MQIRELSREEFDEYSKNHILKSYYQTSSYGKIMEKNGFSSIFIGGYREGNLVCASLILSKNIAMNIKYGYAPRGFLINYYDHVLLTDFTTALKEYFGKKGYAFIKINPEVTLDIVDLYTDKKFINTKSEELVKVLTNSGYMKLQDNLRFESLLPRFNPIINLKEYDIDSVKNYVKNKVTKNTKRGLTLFLGDEYQINTFYELIKSKHEKEIEYYKQYYRAFNEKGMIDLVLVEIDFHEFLKSLQKDYLYMSEENEIANREFSMNPNSRSLYNAKMESDRKLNELNKEIISITNRLASGDLKKIVAGAYVIKYQGRVNIAVSGFDKKEIGLNPNYFLHYKIIEYYKEQGYSFIDLNGITGDLSKENPYRGLNEFKLNFNPVVYEYIGEFDLVVNNTYYQLLWTTKKLHKEFEKKK